MKSKTRSGLVSAVLLAGLLSVVMLGGCVASPKTNTDTSALSGTWVLKGFGAPKGLTPPDPAVTTEMTLADGKASGSGGVNTFSSDYEAKNNGSMRFGAVAATLMAGPDAAMQQESEFFSALEKTRHFEIYQGDLVLSALGNDTLVVMQRKK